MMSVIYKKIILKFKIFCKFSKWEIIYNILRVHNNNYTETKYKVQIL